MTTPRNQPCPCGSKKKFKRCCWNPIQRVPATVPLVIEPQQQTEPASTTAEGPAPFQYRRRRHPASTLALLAMVAGLGASLPPVPPRFK